MEIRQGIFPLATLAVIFVGLQVWWISTTIKNGRESENTLQTKKEANGSKKDPLKDKKDKLEKLLEK